MFCNKCGAEAEKDAKFCVKCGASFAAAPAPKTKAAVPAPAEAEKEAAEITKKMQAKKVATTATAEPKIIYSQKSQVITVILAFLLGTLGIHNFYVGRKGKGFGQMCLSLLPIIICTLVYVIGYAVIWNRCHGDTDWFIYEFQRFLPAVYFFGIIASICLIIAVIWAFVDFLKAIDGQYKDRQGLLLRPPVFHVKADR